MKEFSQIKNVLQNNKNDNLAMFRGGKAKILGFFCSHCRPLYLELQPAEEKKETRSQYLVFMLFQSVDFEKLEWNIDYLEWHEQQEDGGIVLQDKNNGFFVSGAGDCFLEPEIPDVRLISSYKGVENGFRHNYYCMKSKEPLSWPVESGSLEKVEVYDQLAYFKGWKTDVYSFYGSPHNSLHIILREPDGVDDYFLVFNECHEIHIKNSWEFGQLQWSKEEVSNRFVWEDWNNGFAIRGVKKARLMTETEYYHFRAYEELYQSDLSDQ